MVYSIALSRTYVMFQVDELMVSSVDFHSATVLEGFSALHVVCEIINPKLEVAGGRLINTALRFDVQGDPGIDNLYHNFTTLFS